MDGVTVRRVGTQVVVRLEGDISDQRSERLDAVLQEIGVLVLNRVAIDCSGATVISGAGLRFLAVARSRWRVRLIDPPPGLARNHAARPDQVA